MIERATFTTHIEPDGRWIILKDGRPWIRSIDPRTPEETKADLAALVKALGITIHTHETLPDATGADGAPR